MHTPGTRRATEWWALVPGQSRRGFSRGPAQIDSDPEEDVQILLFGSNDGRAGENGRAAAGTKHIHLEPEVPALRLDLPADDGALASGARPISFASAKCRHRILQPYAQK
jgi:hypothetical protein